MPLAIETFDNRTGPSAFFKAVGHPLAIDRVRALLDEVAGVGPVAVYDPDGHARSLFELVPVAWRPIAYLVQRLEHLGRTLAGLPARPVSEVGQCGAGALLIAAYDAERTARQIGPLLPEGIRVRSLDEARLPAPLLSRPERYLDPLNFATNQALFRDGDGLWTRLATANYWAGYGAEAPRLLLWLFDGGGRTLAHWEEALGSEPRSVVIDSRTVRARFGLPPFTGTLLLHAIGIRGHDTVKYALDIGGLDGRVVSATHDANAFPADLYAGLPAPAPGERVILWLQNAHPTPAPAGAVALAAMGEERSSPCPAIPPFGTVAIDVGEALPGLGWPRQVEARAGRHIARPRYEVVTATTRAIAHMNVERTDIGPERIPPGARAALGKGPVLVAPVPPPETWRTVVLPTPMARHEAPQTLIARLYDPEGREIGRRPTGPLPRNHGVTVDVDGLLPADPPPYGHLELGYDPAWEGVRDGWLHALFRYRTRDGVTLADTSFGAHVFNLPVTYQGEPQSYAGPPPGLSTRLFLRLAAEGDTICHLIYPASGTWLPRSTTRLSLHDIGGREVARHDLAIPINGSRRLSMAAIFPAAELARARGGYAIVRDLTCRLFGYHGVACSGPAFSLDHMFGF